MQNSQLPAGFQPVGPPIQVSAEEVNRIQAGFMASVYAWMATGLGFTGVTALLTVSYPPLLHFIFGTPFVYIGLIIGTLALVGFMAARLLTWTRTQAQVAFVAYSVINGLMLSTVFLRYTADSLTSTFFTAAGMFGVMSAFGYLTKSNLLGWGKLLSMAVIGLLIAMVVNFFLASSMLNYLVSGVGVLLFTALAAYDTQKLKEIALLEVTEGPEYAHKASIMGALTLYLDFLNLFLFLLRFTGNRR